MNSQEYEGCQKAFYVSGVIRGLICQIKNRFLEQDRYINELEKRLSSLEKEVLASKNEKTAGNF